LAIKALDFRINLTQVAKKIQCLNYGEMEREELMQRQRHRYLLGKEVFIAGMIGLISENLFEKRNYLVI